MRNMRFRTRVFISFCSVLILAVLLPGMYVYHTMEKELFRESRHNALQQLDFVHWMLEKNAPFESKSALDNWCTTLGEKLGYRITLITAGGVVIADSSVPYKELRFMENHAGRKEIRAAGTGDPAVSVRFSDTLNRKLIYAAQKIRSPFSDGEPLYLRTAYPVSSVENRMSNYMNKFLAGIVLILGLALIFSIYLARRFERPVRQVMDRLKAIADGDFSHQYIMEAGREFYELSMTLNETADRIREQMEVISEQNREMEAIIENMREGVMLIGKNGQIKELNRSMGNIADCQLSCIGKRPLEVFLNSEVQTACDKILQGKDEYSATLPMGDDTFYEMYAAKIPEGGALIVLYDVSEQKRLEKIRRDFVANVSHELKTPLTSIKGYVDTLLSGEFSMDEQGCLFLSTIQKNAAQMTNMVNDLLQLTRLEEKSPDLNLQPVDAASLLRSTWEDFQPLAEENRIKLDNLVESPLWVYAHEPTLSRVFRNLIDNAVQYSPEGGTITAFSEVSGKDIIFGIRDQGPGISPKHQERIFERFYRIDKERSRASGGTGLGLSICKHAVSAMQGRIWVNSPPPGETKGTVFYFSLPRADSTKDTADPSGQE
ncbi:MAG: cell wall metabolism sensor histidine kinase WalK [Desulfobacteraceae bacterium]|nr:cell wall metabolism sensor histidine kinase WalK [Desulfobacteraceae bacterium]